MDKEVALGVEVEIKRDSVLSPDVIYNGFNVSIYFNTQDNKFGRISFENFDSVKISRGEYFPYKQDYDDMRNGCWVWKVKNSSWQKERYNYEKTHYGTFYQFTDNVDEMITDFSHYLFIFHDQFIEVIAKGFWIEKSNKSLTKKEFSINHPLNNLSKENTERYEHSSLICEIRRNKKDIEQLKKDAQFCSQKLMQFSILLDGSDSISETLILTNKDGKIKTSLHGYFGQKNISFDKIADFEDIKPYLNKYMEDVSNRRKSNTKFLNIEDSINYLKKEFKKSIKWRKSIIQSAIFEFMNFQSKIKIENTSNDEESDELLFELEIGDSYQICDKKIDKIEFSFTRQILIKDCEEYKQIKLILIYEISEKIKSKSFWSVDFRHSFDWSEEIRNLDEFKLVENLKPLKHKIFID